jgi:hypothetical protein
VVVTLVLLAAAGAVFVVGMLAGMLLAASYEIKAQAPGRAGTAPRSELQHSCLLAPASPHRRA